METRHETPKATNRRDRGRRETRSRLGTKTARLKSVPNQRDGPLLPKNLPEETRAEKTEALTENPFLRTPQQTCLVRRLVANSVRSRSVAFLLRSNKTSFELIVSAWAKKLFDRPDDVKFLEIEREVFVWLA